MGEAGSPNSLTFRVHIHEGVDLGRDLQACVCHVGLGDTVRQTPFTIQRDRHVWDTILQYSIPSKEQWRRLCNSSTCKVVVYRKAKEGATSSSTSAQSNSPSSAVDLQKLGWVVLDLRNAKLNKQYNKDQGEWYTLVGSRPGSAPVPRLRISYYLEEDLVKDADMTSKLESAVQQQVARAMGGTEADTAQLDSARPITSTATAPQASAVALHTVRDSHPSMSPQPSYSSDFSSHAGEAAQADAHPQDSAASPNSPPPRHEAQGTAHIDFEREPSLSGHDGQEDIKGTAVHGSTAGPAGVQQHTTGPAYQPPVPVAAPAQQVALKLDGGPLKSFTLSIDIRSFQASRHMPFNVCSTYVQATLPVELKEVVSLHGGRIPPRMSPLVSRPAVDVARGMEQPIPNGSGSVEFVCGVLHLARTLAREPRISCEVWHKERLRADTLVGLASVPLSPLLHDCWVDGLAPVYALLAAAPPGSASPVEEKVQVGTLRVVLSLQDGPAPAPAPAPTPAPASAAPAPAAPVPSQAASGPMRAPTAQLATTVQRAPGALQGTVPQDITRGPQDVTRGPQQQAQHARTPSPPQLVSAQQHVPGTPHQFGQQQPQVSAVPIPTVASQQGPAGQQPQYLQPPHLPPLSPAQHGQQQQSRPVAGPTVPSSNFNSVTGLTPAMIQQLPEYEVAYQLEVWKKAEEAKWRAELKSREAARMSLLESEWRRKDTAREAEINTMRQEYVALDTRTRQVLAAVEDRERKLVSTEETAALRRRDMEREHTARMAEAEAAVRRLQVECEHQLEIERDRNTELARLRLAAEERLAAAETRAAALEQAFAAYREQMRNTSEAALAREVMSLKDQLQRAEDRVAKLQKAKTAYKAQVVQLAEQVAALQRQVDTATAAGGPDVGRKQWLKDPSGYALQQAADQQARYANAQQNELAAIKQQLQALKQSALSSPGPAGQAQTATPTAPTPPSSAPHTQTRPAMQPAVQESDVRRSADQLSGRTQGQQQVSAQPQQGSQVTERQVQQQAARPHPVPPLVGLQGTISGLASQRLQQPQTSGLHQTATLQPQVLDAADQRSGEAWSGQPAALVAAAGQTAHGAVQAQPSRMHISSGEGGSLEVASQTGFEAAGQLRDGYTPTRSHSSVHTVTPSRIDGQAAKLHYHDHEEDGSLMQDMYYGVTISAAGIQASPAGTAGQFQSGTTEDIAGHAVEASMAVQRSSSPVAGPASRSSPPRVAAVQASQPNLGEIQRLLRRKSELLATGAYPADDPLINRIEDRVAELAGLPHS